MPGSQPTTVQWRPWRLTRGLGLALAVCGVLAFGVLWVELSLVGWLSTSTWLEEQHLVVAWPYSSATLRSDPGSTAEGVNMRPAPVKPNVSIHDLQKLDIRVGTIRSVDDVAESKKLVKLTVSFGDHTRTILAGMKQERSDPSEIVGRQALFVVNLPPRKMAGVESQGMLFDLGYEDGITPALAVPESPVPDGTRAG